MLFMKLIWAKQKISRTPPRFSVADGRKKMSGLLNSWLIARFLLEKIEVGMLESGIEIAKTVGETASF